MLSLPLPVRVYLCLEPTDMRQGFAFCRMVREHVGADPLSGDLFVFRALPFLSAEAGQNKGQGIW